ncbi:MAG: VOC family protein [Actinobacteria bacterium]|nr:VOC family protein [Actinomycetota bacterium]
MERTRNGEFNWVDLSATDLEQQSAFYEALFGWQHTDTPMGDSQIYRMFKLDGHTVAGMAELSPDQKQQRPSAWNTYVAVDDLDKTVAKAEELGATVTMPPADVPGGVGRLASIQDPTGAYIFFWKPSKLDESMEYMMPGTLSWDDLGTRDPQRAIDFYSKLLGWDIEPMPGGQMPYWVVNIDGQGEGGVMPMPEMVPAEIPAYWLPYFGTEDLKTSVSKAKELGATVLVEPTEVPEMVAFAVLADPAGASFALMQPLRAA